ncbi:CAP domain-containing protein [Evansella cellulosilytica]|uniref:SCP-like extracellular n=1 Tax=Evansella cellulosilytica (strain ATCC 21833 / DSM 2522 / FERM P-1141 / JCM 9156 / N-4) TaxID=649639 RepID=E6TRQ8_EVAC2|nr:CAP domain-containing protein [Evansella cellulosilytica]ADU29431.1 SCP-like extracellular [Evansella cellulosilytica DSM 2522]
MRRFILLIMIVFLAYVSKPLWEEHVQQLDPTTIMESFSSKVNEIKEDEAFLALMDSITQQIDLLLDPTDGPREERDVFEDIAAPELAEPREQPFSIHNVEIGNTRAEVEEIIGRSPNRSTLNEYGGNWNTYHHDYQNFIMVAYDEDDIVRGLYTNQDLIASSTDISLGSSMQFVQEQLGTPESVIRYGTFNYQLTTNGEYDVFHLDNKYVTIFYDQHENKTVTAMKVIDDEWVRNKTGLYTKPSQQLQEGFEYQLFDVTNATRRNHGLPLLTWDEHVRGTARKHSLDMAENEYFSHTNLQGQSPFERMKEDNIQFMMAAENLAYGQISSIFAHEGLMNSIGHRENILNKDLRRLGVGVAFNDDSKPYYTKKYFSS